MSNDKMRAAFVKWANGETFSFKRAPDGGYYWSDLDSAWRAWQAALAAQAQEINKPVDELLMRIRNELDHAQMNDMRLAPVFGQAVGDPAVRISSIVAAIEGWKIASQTNPQVQEVPSEPEMWRRQVKTAIGAMMWVECDECDQGAQALYTRPAQTQDAPNEPVVWRRAKWGGIDGWIYSEEMPTEELAWEPLYPQPAPASAHAAVPEAWVKYVKDCVACIGGSLSDRGRALLDATPAQAAVPDAVTWIDLDARLPEVGELIVKRWRNGSVWAGRYAGGRKDSGCDQWLPLSEISKAAPSTQQGGGK